MDELINQMVTAAKSMWRHRWLGLMVAWAVTVLGALIVMSVPNRYEASARIFVDTQSILKPLMAGLAVQPNVEQQVMMLSRTLISRPNVEKLVRMADLDLNAHSKVAQDAMIDGLMKSLAIKNLGQDNLYVLSYRDTSPERAKKVVQSLVSIFIESSLGDTRTESGAAKQFIDAQIKNYETKLQDAEARLKEFKVRNVDLQNSDGLDSVGQLGAVSNQFNQARLELREAVNARDSARRQLDAEKSPSANLTSRSLLQESALTISTPKVDARIEAQKSNLDALLQRFTEQHPDVVGARRMIHELEDLKRKEVEKLRATTLASPPPGLTSSLVYQELSRLLAASEVQVAALQARTSEYESRLARVRERMKTAPQMEAEFSQLNRDYDINKKNYNDLVARREQVTLSGNLDNTGGVANFRLIDPPRASPNPVAPNRLLLMPLALLAALGAGLGASYVASQLRAVFNDAHSLRETVRLPLLGAVTLVMDDDARRRESSDLRKFLGASGGLVGIFIAGMIVLSMMSGRAG